MRYSQWALLLLVLGAMAHSGKSLFVDEDCVEVQREVTIDADGVHVLTKVNFQSIIDRHEFVLVNFYAPWCAQCKVLAREYAKVAKHFAGLGSRIKLAKIDSMAHRPLADRFKVIGFPTLKLFRSGKPVDYRGVRQAIDIVPWVTRKAQPPAVELCTIAMAEEFLRKHDIAIIGFFGKRRSHNAKIFVEIADELNNFHFGISIAHDVKATFGATRDAVMLFKKSDDRLSIFEKEFTKDNLRKFVQSRSLPLIAEYNHTTALNIFGAKVETYLIFFVSKVAGHFEEYIEPLKTLAAEFREQIIFCTVATDSADSKIILDFFDVSIEECPKVKLFRLTQTMVGYKPEPENVTASNIKEFLRDYMTGKLQPIVESIEERYGRANTAVTILEPANFYPIVLDETKDVLVLFCADWCSHCELLDPIYDQLGKIYKKNNTVVIAKMDYNALYELDYYAKLRALPTIRLFTKGFNFPIEYKLARTLNDFVRFIEAGGKIDGEHHYTKKKFRKDEF